MGFVMLYAFGLGSKVYGVLLQYKFLKVPRWMISYLIVGYESLCDWRNNEQEVRVGILVIGSSFCIFSLRQMDKLIVDTFEVVVECSQGLFFLLIIFAMVKYVALQYMNGTQTESIKGKIRLLLARLLDGDDPESSLEWLQNMEEFMITSVLLRIISFVGYRMNFKGNEFLHSDSTVTKKGQTSFVECPFNTDARKPTIIKEIRLPQAKEVHEMVWEPLTQCLYVALMAESKLVRIPLGSDEFLEEDQDCWVVGQKKNAAELTEDALSKDEISGVSGLHNISLSYKYKGCLWLSLEYSNQLVLLDVFRMQIKKVYQCPTVLPNNGGKIGGPHCVREKDGIIYVALKGAQACNPAQQGMDGENDLGILRGCCGGKKIERNMESTGAEIPDAYAMFKLDINDLDKENEKYKEDAVNKGGDVFKCKKSPPMQEVDAKGQCWFPQDGAMTIGKISKGEVDIEVDVPHPSEHFPSDAAIQTLSPKPPNQKITGPSICQDPRGNLWMTELCENGVLVRIDKNENKVAYIVPKPKWVKAFRIIHLTFVEEWKQGGIQLYPNTMFAISTSLLDKGSPDAVIVITMDEEWKEMTSYRVVPLATQNSECHRIAAITAPLHPSKWSVVVSMFSPLLTNPMARDSKKRVPMPGLVLQMRVRDLQRDLVPLVKKTEKKGRFEFFLYEETDAPTKAQADPDGMRRIQ